MSTPSPTLSSLRTPIIAAPMAGGPTTPALVTAAANAGGMGFLAAGYQTVEALHSDITTVREAGTTLFGVNLFITLYDDARRATTDAEIDEFSRTLTGIAESAGLDGPAPAEFTDNDYAGKVDYLCAHPVPVVSFTFGAPDADVVDRLHDAGTEVAIMVTSFADAELANQRGADLLIAQGTEAGGHQSTFSIAESPHGNSTLELVREIRANFGETPIIATGGLHSYPDARAAFDVGTDAIQVGTALLNTPEAGTSAAYRYGLTFHFENGSRSDTEFTRGFSGRPARSIVNEFVRATEQAPAAYPFNNQMTKPLRAAAAKLDPKAGAEYVALWCGRSSSSSSEAPSGFLDGDTVAGVFDGILPSNTTD